LNSGGPPGCSPAAGASGTYARTSANGQWRSKLQSTLWNLTAKYNVRISGSQWRELDEVQDWLQPKPPKEAGEQAQRLAEQNRQLQIHIRQLQQRIAQPATFREDAQQTMQAPGH